MDISLTPIPTQPGQAQKKAIPLSPQAPTTSKRASQPNLQNPQAAFILPHPILAPLQTPFSATNSLSTFMALHRGVFPPSRTINTTNSMTSLPHPQTASQFATTHSPAPNKPPRQIPNPSPIRLPPPLPNPLPKATFVLATSMTQSHRIYIRAIKSLWGSRATWIERDYDPPTRYHPSLNQHEGQDLPLLLSPHSGMYFTTLQRIQQKVLLPGEKANEENDKESGRLRKKVMKMSRRVERLWIVVLGSGSDGMMDRGSEAWAEFVDFCSGIEGGENGRVIPIFVKDSIMEGGGGRPRDERAKTIAQWICGIMVKEVNRFDEVVRHAAPWWCVQYEPEVGYNPVDARNGNAPYDLHKGDETPEGAIPSPWLSPTETETEEFLRRVCALNVFQAGVVSRVGQEISDEENRYDRGEGGGGDGVEGILNRALWGELGPEETKVLRGLMGERAMKRLVEGVVREWRRNVDENSFSPF